MAEGADRSEYNRKWREQNRERIRVRMRVWYAANKHRIAANEKARRAASKDKAAERARKWYAANKQRAAAYGKAYRTANPDVRAATQALRHARKLRATPPWVDLDEIQKIYTQAAAAGQHVDHIHPLRGKTFCGLHVPWNLQLLDPTENRRKSNKLLPEMVE